MDTPIPNKPAIGPPAPGDKDFLWLMRVPINATKKISELIAGRGESLSWIVTLNPEILVAAHRDASYHEALTKANVIVADGVGIKIMAALLKQKMITKITGIHILKYIIDRAASRGETIGIVSPPDALSSPPELKRLGQKYGAQIMVDVLVRDEFRCSYFCQSSNMPVNLFISFGHPTQEFWIARHKDHLGAVKFVVGVGGAFDFLTGQMPRAPWILQIAGLEWLWRFMVEPGRWRRIIEAIIIFPYLAIRYG